jgi:hypothetical protein
MSEESAKPKKHKRGPAPVIIPKKIYDWAKDQAGDGKVNSWRVGGGRPSYNGGK